MTKDELLERCRAAAKRLEGGIPKEVLSESGSLNRFFIPYMQKVALRGILLLLSEGSLLELIDEIERTYKCTIDQVRRINRGKRVAVIMAGNIPAVGFSDFFCPLICGFSMIVKYSSKDMCFMKWVAGVVGEFLADEPIEETTIENLQSISDNLSGVVFAGADETKSVVAQQLGTIPLLARGSLFSYGVVSDGIREDEQQLGALCDDCFLYFGLGCRSISYLFVPKNFDWQKFITIATDKYGAILDSNKAWRNSYLQNRALLQMEENEHFIDGGCFLFHKSDKVFPPLSVIYCREYDNLEEIEQFAMEHREQIQKKYTNFGKAQFPLLTDWQDGVSTVVFLSTI